MIVIVAEKPSVGRDIARVLHCTARGDGCLIGKEYTVTWAVGHLVTLCEPQEVDEKYKKWRAEDLPIIPEHIPTKVISKTRSQYSVVKKLITDKQTDRIICATDAGREGELIFRLIYDKAKCAKPVDRLWISSMTDAAIKEGFDALKPSQAYDGLYQSALCRAEADWLVGMNASRAFTLRYGALLSVGRVQTPTLAILVKRAEEIRAFVPETYYTLTADFGDYQGQWFDENVKEDKLSARIETEERAKEIASVVKKQRGVVRDAGAESKREMPPNLYDLTSLQRDANKMLGFTASKTLKVAQALYETHKAITYPRTDSKYLPDDMAERVLKTLKGLPDEYHAFLKTIPAEGGKLPRPARVYDNEKITDHHAIIPTAQPCRIERLDKDEKALFDLVARRLIAAFYPPYEYEAVKVVTDVCGHLFKTTGRTVKNIGWKALYRDKQKEDKALPPLAAGDERDVKSVKTKKEATKPPNMHTDATLLAAMEHAGRDIEDEELRERMKGSGLGTPATRAAMIDRLIQVGYAERKGKAIIPTRKGEKLISVVPPEIASPEMTGKWEKALSEIADGMRGTERYMQGIERLTRFLVNYTVSSAPDVAFERETSRGGKGRKSGGAKTVAGVKCPLCGQSVQETEKAFGCSRWRDGCGFTVWKDALARSGGPEMTAKILKSLLTEGAVKGSTGVVALKDGLLSYTENGRERPGVSVPVNREKNGNAG